MANRQFSDYIRRLNPDFDAGETASPDDSTTPESPGPEDDKRSKNAGNVTVLPHVGAAPMIRLTQQSATAVPAQSEAPAALGAVQLPQLPQLPHYNEQRSSWGIISFLLVFVIPVCMISAYYLYVASDIYTTNFRFSVRNVSSNQTTSAMSSAMALVGMPNNSDSVNYQVADYLSSRAAVDQLQDSIGVVSIYTRPSIDLLSRFNGSRSLESFESYWKSMVSAKYDQVTGIVSVSVQAFRPQDSYLIATSLVKAAEDLVNSLEQRTLDDAVQSATLELTKAQAKLEDSHLKLTLFRKASGVIDPTSSFVASNSALVQTLQSSLATLETRYSLLANQKMDPKGISMASLSQEIEATKEQLRASGSSVATARNFTPPGGTSLDKEALSNVIAQYEKLSLDYQFAQTLVTTAMGSLEQAKVSAFTQHLYVTPYVRPSLPTSAQSRTLNILLAAGICFVLWFVSYALLSDVRERFAYARR